MRSDAAMSPAQFEPLQLQHILEHGTNAISILYAPCRTRIIVIIVIIIIIIIQPYFGIALKKVTSVMDLLDLFAVPP
jgi:hypothetical protein